MARPKKNNFDADIEKQIKVISKIKSDIENYRRKIAVKEEDLKMAEEELKELKAEKERAEKADILERLIDEGFTLDEIKKGIEKLKETNVQ